MSKTQNLTALEKSEYLIPIVAFVLLAAAALLVLYGQNFFGALSNQQGDWGTFGDYIGGTLNPIIGLLSLVAIVRSLQYQSEQIRLATEQSKEQQILQTEQSRIALKASEAQTYFLIIESINSNFNDKQIQALRRTWRQNTKVMLNFESWDQSSVALARDISNRYQIVAHLVERDFLSKAMFFENFSGTVVDAWNLCAPYVAYRRMRFNPSSYLRRDFERLALQCWLYQCDEGLSACIRFIDEKFVVRELDAENGRPLALKKISSARRTSLAEIENRVGNYDTNKSPEA